MLDSREIHSQLLQTSHAFHSEMLEPLTEEFTKRVSQLNLSAPSIPFISNVTGTWITNADAMDPNYWTRHLRQTVRFADGVSELFQKPHWILIEVGPGRTLHRLAKQNAPKNQQHVILNTMSGPQKEHSDVNDLLTAFGKFWLAGGRVDWQRFNAGKQRRRVPLPTYPFERKRYFVEPQARHPGSSNGRRTHKAPLQNWLYLPSWKRVPLGGAKKNIQEGAWLVFADETNVGAELARRLRSAGGEVMTAKAGEDYQSLVKALSAMDVRRVVHLWSLTGDEALESLIFLTQTLAKDPKPLELLVVTDSMQEVNGDEVLRPDKAAVLSACKVIPLEHPNVHCRSVDVITGDSERLAAQLFSEITADTTDRSLAYRGRHRSGDRGARAC